jgi:hypothetical protein
MFEEVHRRTAANYAFDRIGVLAKILWAIRFSAARLG